MRLLPLHCFFHRHALDGLAFNFRQMRRMSLHPRLPVVFADHRFKSRELLVNFWATASSDRSAPMSQVCLERGKCLRGFPGLLFKRMIHKFNPNKPHRHPPTRPYK